MSHISQEQGGSETDIGSSPFKNIPDVDKQILEWASKLELETIQIRDTSERLFGIVKQNVDELAASRKLFETESSNRKSVLNDSEFERITTSIKTVHEKSVDEVVGRVKNEIHKKMSEELKSYNRKWSTKFEQNERVVFNLMQQMQDLTDAIHLLHNDMQNMHKRQEDLENNMRRQTIATPESCQNSKEKPRLLIPWEEIQDYERQ